MTALITAGLSTTAVLILTVAARTIARDGGDDVEHHGADEKYAAQLHDLADVTVEMAVIAAECPPELAPQPHRGRHYHDTVEIVTDDYRPLYSPAFAAVMGYDREQVSA